MNRRISSSWLLLFALYFTSSVRGEETRLLRQPTLSDTHVAFTYGSDLWTVGRDGGRAIRITSTSAVEQSPHFSPDGKWIAFTSNRSGTSAVYVVSVEGGTPTRLTWYPSGSVARGWTPDGEHVLYSTTRETAPASYERLWTVPMHGGPSKRLPAHWGFDGSFSPSGKRIVVDRVSRWDTEWRHYRGGQNTPLTILNLDTLAELRIDNDRTTDIQPIWLGEKIYFLSDRDWVMNIWSYDPSSKELEQLTEFTGSDIKWLNGIAGTLVYERNGYLSTFDLERKEPKRLKIEVVGDFPWAEKRWESVTDSISSASLSTTGKRALFEARGEVFTVPIENGSPRNLTQSSGGADRSPMWSPKGDKVAWFSDDGNGYKVLIANQDGTGDVEELGIGDSKMAWEATWSPDGTRIAFVDNDVQVRVLEIESGEIKTAGAGGVNIERGSMGLTWSPDSKWLAYAKSFPNNLRRIMAWSVARDETLILTDSMADSMSPTWDRDGKHLYFLASTDVALASGWANTSRISAEPRYGAYVMLLSDDAESPFAPESDEEEVEDEADSSEESKDSKSEDGDDSKSEPEASKQAKAKVDDVDEAEAEAEATEDSEKAEKKSKKRKKKRNRKKIKAVEDSESEDEPAEDKETAEGKDPADEGESDSDDESEEESEDADDAGIEIDLEGLSRRILALPISPADLRFTLSGPEGSVFIAESPESGGGLTLHKFTLKDEKKTEFLSGISSVATSSDGKKMLYRAGGSWSVTDTGGPKGSGKGINVNLQMQLDRQEEWEQIFEEAWRYMRDFFYDPNMHGRDWDLVRERYTPLVPFIRHRADLSYLLDQMSGEMSVGHSFVFGGDYPEIDQSSRVGLLGADLEAEDGRWKFSRIYTFESWNPRLQAALDRPGLKVEEGHYLLGVNGVELTEEDEPYRLLDGTAGQQTTLRIGESPDMEDSWTVVVEPQRSENALRQRAWVEDNRRRVDELSDGKLAYVWIPNTGQPGVISFNRYFFAQQDKLGAVIDERYNGGGLLDDYMVDLMTRNLRAGLTNEVPGAQPFRLPAGLLGPKVLLINERAGSGGDFFPWVFRQQKAGSLIGTRTWGGLVKSSVHYPFVDGGAMTAPDNAVFDPINKEWIAENEGVPPDIEVLMDSKSTSKGIDPQLERGVEELLKLIEANPPTEIEVPDFPTPTIKK